MGDFLNISSVKDISGQITLDSNVINTYFAELYEVLNTSEQSAGISRLMETFYRAFEEILEAAPTLQNYACSLLGIFQ